MADYIVSGRAVALAALALIDAPFRLHGRDAATGLDCVGLCLTALKEAGWPVVEPPNYVLRGAVVSRVERIIEQQGLIPAVHAGEGDVVIARTGPMQLHLMIASAHGHVHAHAGLGRVVHMPGASLWPVLSRWRVPDSPRPVQED
jgi:cell wall-associated NlpC family hydrolase